jgi:hypothetical protein
MIRKRGLFWQWCTIPELYVTLKITMSDIFKLLVTKFLNRKCPQRTELLEPSIYCRPTFCVREYVREKKPSGSRQFRSCLINFYKSSHFSSASILTWQRTLFQIQQYFTARCYIWFFLQSDLFDFSQYRNISTNLSRDRLYEVQETSFGGRCLVPCVSTGGHEKVNSFLTQLLWERACQYCM